MSLCPVVWLGHAVSCQQYLTSFNNLKRFPTNTPENLTVPLTKVKYSILYYSNTKSTIC